MSIDELNRQYQELLRQEANLEYQIGQAEKQMAGYRVDLAKVQGKKELIESMAQAEQEGPSGRPGAERMDVAEAKRERKPRHALSAANVSA